MQLYFIAALFFGLGMYGAETFSIDAESNSYVSDNQDFEEWCEKVGPFIAAISFRNVDMVRSMLEHHDVDFSLQSNKGWLDALVLETDESDFDNNVRLTRQEKIAQLIIEHGGCDHMNISPLTFMSLFDQSYFLTFLLKNKFPVNSLDETGSPLLYYAIRAQEINMIRHHLLPAGADPLIVVHHRQRHYLNLLRVAQLYARSAPDYAAKLRYQGLYELLKNHAKKTENEPEPER